MQDKARVFYALRVVTRLMLVGLTVWHALLVPLRLLKAIRVARTVTLDRTKTWLDNQHVSIVKRVATLQKPGAPIAWSVE